MGNSERYVLEVLTRGRRRLMVLFDELTAANDPVARWRVLDRLTVELVRDAVVRETHLYPVVRRHLPGGDEIADRRLSGITTIESLLAELQTSVESDDAFTALGRRLSDEVDERLRDEEGTLIPRLAALAGPEGMRRLGERIEAATARPRERSEVWDLVRPRLVRIVGAGPDRHPGPSDGGTRPRTPRDPGGNEQSSMWPDLWAGHRC